VTDRRLRLAEIERHLEGSDAESPYLGEFAVLTTGGTTGRRGVFVLGPDDLAHSLAGMMRTMGRLGGAARIVSVMSPSPLHLSKRWFQAVGGQGPSLDVTMPLPVLVAGLNAARPEVLVTYPTIATLLAAEQVAGRLHIAPRLVACGAEVVTERTRRAVHEAWGAPTGNGYAATEGGMIASSCPLDCGLHLAEDQVVLEAVDEDGRPVPPGVPSARVLLTNLTNLTLPLIRYEISDSVVVAAGDNPAGYPFRRLERIGGRAEDVLRLPAAAGGEIALHPFHLHAPLVAMAPVVQYQFAFHGDRLEARVVLREDAGPGTTERVRERLARALADAGVAALPIEVRPVPSLARNGAGAKVALVARAA
jgi:phenylacetate-coenzyme A ligase PaaK-like adenylate-forming protein